MEAVKGFFREALATVLMLVGCFLILGGILEAQGYDANPRGAFWFCFFGAGLFVWGLTITLRAVWRVRLYTKVAPLKPLIGKTRAVIKAKLGNPRALEETEDGRQRATWTDGDYELTLTFKDGVCVKAKEAND